MLKNSLAVKGCKMFSVKKVVKSKGVAKKWLWWYRLMAKTLITTIQVNLCCLIPEFSLLKFCHCPILSQPFLGCPLWFHNFLHTGHFEQGHTFLQPGCFWVCYTVTITFLYVWWKNVNYTINRYRLSDPLTLIKTVQ